MNEQELVNISALHALPPPILLSRVYKNEVNLLMKNMTGMRCFEKVKTSLKKSLG
jgi:hypothetical protein